MILSGIKKCTSQYGILFGILIFLYKIPYRLVSYIYIYYIKYFCPIQKNTIVFKSFPDYSDNSKALYEYLEQNGYCNKYKIFWDVKEPESYSSKYSQNKCFFINSKTRFNEFSLKNLKKIMTAEMLMGTHSFSFDKKYAIAGQKYIMLWHGCSFKGKTTADKKNKGDEHFDVALVAGPLFVKLKSDFWNCSENRILPLGYPRYDWLLKKSEAAIRLRSELLDNNLKIIIWMPTFRNDIGGRYMEGKNGVKFPLIGSLSEWQQLDAWCRLNKVVIVVKLHAFQKDYSIGFDAFSNIVRIDNEYIEKADVPLYDFLSVTDGLISDYSSVAIDYLVVDRPIGFVLDDFESYNVTRGFICEDPRKYMGGHHLYKLRDLKQFVLDVAEERDVYYNARRELKGKVITIKSNYRKEIVDKIGISL